MAEAAERIVAAYHRRVGESRLTVRARTETLFYGELETLLKATVVA